MSRGVRIGLGVLAGIVIVVGVGVGYTLLVGSRPDIGNPDFATVERTLPGTWVSQPTSRADFIAGLADEFTEAELGAEMDRLHYGDPVSIELTFGENATISAASIAGATTYPIAVGTYRLVDNHSMMLTRADCTVPAQFQLRGGMLTFGTMGDCPTQPGALSLAVVLRGAPFDHAAAP